MKRKYLLRLRFPTLALLMAMFAPLAAAPVQERPTPNGPWYEDEDVFIRIVLRTPEQLTAFYIGRGFNQGAIDRILQTCFITPVVENKALDVLWLELDHWQFSRGQTQVARIGRDYWPAQWEAAALPQAQRSTFWWTLMPDVRDLRLDEGAGGSVAIPWQDAPFTLTMNFHTGADKKGPVKTVVFKDLTCPTDTP